MKKIVLIMSVGVLLKIILIFSIAALLRQSTAQQCEYQIAETKLGSLGAEQRQNNPQEGQERLSLLRRIMSRNMICVPYNSGFGTP